MYFYGFTMPTKKNLCLTQSQRKNKIIHLEQNAPIKRARLLVMKRLASEYLSSDFNGKFRYDIFYKQSSKVYPWLKKSYYGDIVHVSYIILSKLITFSKLLSLTLSFSPSYPLIYQLLSIKIKYL